MTKGKMMTEIGEVERQYSIGKILFIWALAAIPMGILGWVIAPIRPECIFAYFNLGIGIGARLESTSS
jgi:hypothetical protein